MWSGGAVTPVMNVLVPQFERQTGHKVQFRIMTVRQLPQRLAAGERGEMAIAEADTLLLTVPNQLGLDYNAHVIEAILKHVAPELGWRSPVEDLHR